MTNIMIDLETWGTVPGCAIRSIGACRFSFNKGAFGVFNDQFYADPFYVNISLESQTPAFHVDQRTKEWWEKQSAEAQAAFDVDPVHIIAAIDRLWEYVKRHDPRTVKVWCHGLSFDLPILKHIAHACALSKEPWDFRNERDTRTILGLLTPEQQEALPDPLVGYDTKHNALHDAINQANWMIAALGIHHRGLNHG